MEQEGLLACLDCQRSNSAQAAKCQQCGAAMRPAHASHHLDQAEAAILAADYERAVEQLNQADLEMLALRQSERDRYLLSARGFWLQGLMYYSRSMMTEARHELTLARTSLVAQPSGQHLLCNVLLRLGNIGYYQESFDEASSYYRQSALLAARLDNHPLAAKALSNIGVIVTIQGQPDTALDYHLRALTHAEQGGDPDALSQCYRVLANLYSRQGPYSRATEFAAKSIALHSQIESRDTLATLYTEAGRIYRTVGDYRSARQYLHQAQELTRHNPNLINLTIVEVELAILASQQGDPEGWLAFAHHAFNEAHESPLVKAAACEQLALFYAARSDWPHSRHYFQQWREELERGGGDQSNGGLARMEATLCAAVGDWLAAVAAYQRAFSQPLSRYQLALTWQSYAILLAAMPARDPAAECAALQEAATLYRQLELPQQLAVVEAARADRLP